MKTKNNNLILLVLFVASALFCACDQVEYDYGMIPQLEKDKINYDLKVDPQKPVRDYEGSTQP